MIVIRNTKLFKELKEIARLSNFNDEQIWKGLFKDDMGTFKDERIPTFFGGLDHTRCTADSIYFADIGSNWKDNSFVVREEK